MSCADVKRLKTTKMKRNEKKVPGFDEIIFENRNKEYGAYELRKRYKSAASFSILGALGLCALIFTLLTAFAPKDVKKGKDNIIEILITPSNTYDPNKLVQPEIPKPLIVPQKNIYVEPDIVDDTLASGNMIMANDQAINSITDGNVSDTIGPLVMTPVDPDTDKKPNIFIKVEEDPFFPGGPSALLKYIADNTKYPAEAIANNIQGKVIVKFAVWSDGSVKYLEIVRGVNPVLDEEALRVVSTLPLWKPGKQNGEPVSVWFIVPVTFHLINQ